jgi:hypothetical protein
MKAGGCFLNWVKILCMPHAGTHSERVLPPSALAQTGPLQCPQSEDKDCATCGAWEQRLRVAPRKSSPSGLKSLAANKAGGKQSSPFFATFHSEHRASERNAMLKIAHLPDLLLEQPSFECPRSQIVGGNPALLVRDPSRNATG